MGRHSIPELPTKAIIYCRVSSKKQLEGSGLDSQEYRCRQYAEAKGYDVQAVFPDDVSGGGDFMKRRGMVALLKFLDDHPRERFVVIFDDLKRYARDVEFHLKLRRMMEERNAVRECLNFSFENSPEGKFNEIISAAAGELERLQMGRQNRQKSIARLEQGYWVFRAPHGYRYVKGERGGKELVLDEVVAPILREALVGHATGRFASQTEVRRFLESQPDYPKDTPNGTIRPQTVVRLLTKKLYAGFVYAPEWGIEAREGNHPPIISVATFQRNQERLNTPVYAPARKDLHRDFPLRGAVACSCCGTPLTAGWSSGKYKRYAFYRCRKKGCELYGKSIPKDEIEGDFEALLADIQPSPDVLAMAKAMFTNCWELMETQADELRSDIKARIKRTDKDIDATVDLAVQTTNARVRQAYEAKIEKLEGEKRVLQEKLKNPGRTRYTMSQLFEHSMQFLSSPCNVWKTGQFDLQKIVLRLVFSEPVHYSREEGFLNTKFSLPFNMLGGQNMGRLLNGAAGEN